MPAWAKTGHIARKYKTVSPADACNVTCNRFIRSNPGRRFADTHGLVV